jgi:folate-binding protein YgfZ
VLEVRGRACVEVKGKDVLKFMQGLCTTDMAELPMPVRATAFLSPKGRVIAEAFLYGRPGPANRDGKEDIVLVEVDAQSAPALVQMMKVYKLRSKVKITSLGPHKVSLLVPDADQGQSTDESGVAAMVRRAMGQVQAQTEGWGEEDVLVAAGDPRVPNFGVRIVMSADDEKEEETEEEEERWQQQQQGGHDAYKAYRIAHGVAEGVEVVDRIPLECNMDFLNHVDFRKGCYVGQELTARTKFKGVVRKRIVPFVCVGQERPADGTLDFHQAAQTAPGGGAVSASHAAVGSKILALQAGDAEPKSVGTVVSLADDKTSGLALLRLAATTVPDAALVVAPLEEYEGEVRQEFILPHKPSWWPEVDPITEKPLF